MADALYMLPATPILTREEGLRALSFLQPCQTFDGRSCEPNKCRCLDVLLRDLWGNPLATLFARVAIQGDASGDPTLQNDRSEG